MIRRVREGYRERIGNHQKSGVHNPLRDK